MASEPYGITNPKNNNRDLLIYHYDAKGSKRQIAFLRPGESCRPEKQLVWIEERTRPAKLLLAADGTVSPDTKPGGPSKVTYADGKFRRPA